MSLTGGVWRMVLAMSLSGTIGLFVLLSGQTVQTVVFFRCLIGGLSLLSWLSWQGTWQRLSGRPIAWLLLGGVALIVNWLCLFSAFRLSSISIATVVYHVQPFFLVLLAAVLQGEKPGLGKLCWLGLAFVGVALTTGIAPDGKLISGADAHSNTMLMGVLLALVAALLYAVATLTTRKLTGVPPAQIAGLQLMLGVFALAPLADFSTLALRWQSWSSLLVLGLVHTGFMYNVMYAAFQRLPATMIAPLSFIYPVVAILVDFAFFQTALSALQILGIVLILVALIADQRAKIFPAHGARAVSDAP